MAQESSSANLARIGTRNASPVNITGIGAKAVSGAFSGLLSLTSDAVISFDGAGTILLANDAARALFRHHGDFLVGLDVRDLFVAPKHPQAGNFTPDDLPFACDGTTSHVVVSTRDGAACPLVLRCDSVRAPGDTYLLVAHRDNSQEEMAAEHERLVSELSQANHRLSGTLKIVLGTLDSPDVGTLFDRVLNGITQTMDASGTMVYIAEGDGFYLSGTSDSLAEKNLCSYLPHPRATNALGSHIKDALRLRVLPPEGADLRQGRLSRRAVLDEETHEIFKVAARYVPPFVSFLMVPVWFSGRVIAVFFVGWDALHPTRKEDARLLDSVGQYLSVQLMGAFAAMRAQRRDKLSACSTALRERLMAAEALDTDEVCRVMNAAADELDARFISLVLPREESGQVAHSTVVSGAAAAGTHAGAAAPTAPGTLSDGRGFSPSEAAVAELEQTASGAGGVWPLDDSSELAKSLQDAGEDLSRALMVDFAATLEPRLVCVFARSAGTEPFEDQELAFLRRLGEDVSELVANREESAQNKRISQALQSGMKNELAHIDGISAQGLYSSATKSAFVGGDFYALTQLPGRQACIVMGDVSGKGVEAASVSAAVKTALGAYAWEGFTPARMVRSLNDFLLGFSRLETFVTLFVGIVDLDAATLTYCSAGHPPAILLRADSGEYTTLNVQSGVVGAFLDMSYQDGCEKISEGDLLLLYTDGTTEARSPSGDFFGEDGLKEAVMREAEVGFDGICDRLLARLDTFTNNATDDDVAMVALRFDEVGE